MCPCDTTEVTWGQLALFLLKESLPRQIYCLGMYKWVVPRFGVYDMVLLKQRATLQKLVEEKPCSGLGPIYCVVMTVWTDLSCQGAYTANLHFLLSLLEIYIFIGCVSSDKHEGKDKILRYQTIHYKLITHSTSVIHLHFSSRLQTFPIWLCSYHIIGFHL